MKYLCLSFLSLLVAASLAPFAIGGPKSEGAAAEAKWTDDYKDAVEKAKKGKLIFLYFTGSDWCENCMKLDKNILSTPEFAKWAHERAILVKIDSPHHKTLPDDVKEQNAELGKKYKVSEWPTIFILDDNEVKRTVLRGYHDEDVAQWLSNLDEAILKGR